MLDIPCIQVKSIRVSIGTPSLRTAFTKTYNNYAHIGGTFNKIQVQYEALIKKIADTATVPTCNYKDYNYNQYRGRQIIHNTFLPVGVDTNSNTGKLVDFIV